MIFIFSNSWTPKPNTHWKVNENRHSQTPLILIPKLNFLLFSKDEADPNYSGNLPITRQIDSVNKVFNTDT